MTNERDPESLLADAMALAGQAYRLHVKETAADLFQAILDGEVTDREAFCERFHEDIDSDGWVIYTAKAQMVTILSDNGGCGVDDGLVTPECFKDGIPWEKLAYAALEADVTDTLLRDQDDWRVDINEDDLGKDAAWDHFYDTVIHPMAEAQLKEWLRDGPPPAEDEHLPFIREQMDRLAESFEWADNDERVFAWCSHEARNGRSADECLALEIISTMENIVDGDREAYSNAVASLVSRMASC